ncbi:MAG: cytochrome c-type biogenesis protein [Myxococcota bacterium]
MKRRTFLVTGLLCLSLWIAAPAASAEGASASDAPAWAYRLPHDLMSPFCPGRTLAECPSPQADELRLKILLQAAAGASEAEVEEMLVARFGEQILGAPRAEGWGLAAYVLPLGGFAAGGAFVFWALRRLSGSRGDAAGKGAPRPVGAPGPSPSDPELERLLDEELARDPE